MAIYDKNGFSTKREVYLEEIDATLYEFEHKKSGAQLVYLERDDENKTFSIGFPTPPTDDTGVFHIIEHSVLCGSKKYPLKDPFAELLKGSLNTFLNAMTYEDRTVYPVSSRCEKDFLNLVDVYMDAVFAPKFLENPYIFMQEGWHYEYDTESKTLTRNGVVYNEMKGAYSSADELGVVALNRALWNGEIYKYDSGGNPDYIPSLTYESFVNTYRKYYHPSNAKIVLDGKMDLEKLLSLIDSHLSGFERRDPTVLPFAPSKKTPPDTEIRYEISENESESGKARVIYGYVYSDFSDKESHLTASVLSDLLCGSNASPLKKALLEKNLAKDAMMYSIKSRAQTVVIEIRDADETRLDEIDETVKTVIRSLSENGIEKSRLTSTLNSIEFRLRERDFGTLPLGIAFATSAYSTWMYGGAPEDSLLAEKELLSVRKKINSSYFEEELIKMTIENPHRARVIMLPDKEIGRRNADEEKKKLNEILSKMTREEMDCIVNADLGLKKWQEQEETDEALASIPQLSLSDIPQKTDRPSATVSSKDGVKILRCNAKTNGIIYISLHFDASDLSGRELTKLSILSSALINLPTEKQDALSLQNDIKSNLGSLFTSFDVGCRDNVATPYFKLGASSLISKEDDMIRIIEEVLLTSRFDSEEEVANIICQTKSQFEDAIVASGESFAMSRVDASFSEVGRISEHLLGYEAYKILCEITEDKEKTSALIIDLSLLLKKIVDRNRLTISVTGDVSKDFIDRIINLFPNGCDKIVKRTNPPCADKGEFIIVPSKVAFAVAGGNSQAVSKNLGVMRVARSILSYEYLWNTVRVQSGAYGTGIIPRRDGSLKFYSFRDPSPEKSMNFFRASSDYLRNMVKEKIDISKFIIGSIGEYDFIITPKVASSISTRDYLNGYSPEEDILIREDMLKMSTDDLLIAADIIDEVLSNGSWAVVGSAEHLKAFDDLNKTIIKI